MASAPRYSDEQVRLILARAATDATASGALTHSDGHSLAEIERIAAEAGIPTEAVRRAAAYVASGAATPNAIEQRALGIPSALSRRIHVGQRVSGSDWKRIMARLRVLRGAKGKTRDDDALREWRHQGLRVVVESAPGGDIVHVSARESSPLLLAGIGAPLAGFGALYLAAVLIAVDDAKWQSLWVLGAILIAFGGAMIVQNLLSLRRWAREHAQVLDALAEELPALLRSAVGDGER